MKDTYSGAEKQRDPCALPQLACRQPQGAIGPAAAIEPGAPVRVDLPGPAHRPCPGRNVGEGSGILRSWGRRWFRGAGLVADEQPAWWPMKGRTSGIVRCRQGRTTHVRSAFHRYGRWRDDPVRHRFVHGGFEGTDARFAIYFPPPERYQGGSSNH